MTVANGPNSLALTAPFRIDLLVTLFLEAVIAIAVVPPAMATIRASVETTFAYVRCRSGGIGLSFVTLL